MENGERQGKNQYQQRGGNYFPAQWPQSQWQHANGEHDECRDNAENAKPNQERRHLGCRPFFIVPVHADLLARNLRSPPGQQVPELQVATNMPIKCANQMENGVQAHVGPGVL